MPPRARARGRHPGAVSTVYPNSTTDTNASTTSSGEFVAMVGPLLSLTMAKATVVAIDLVWLVDFKVALTLSRDAACVSVVRIGLLLEVNHTDMHVIALTAHL